MEKGYPPIWYEWGFSEEERFEHYRQICKRVGYGCIPTPSVEAAKEIITEVFGDGGECRGLRHWSRSRKLEQETYHLLQHFQRFGVSCLKPIRN